jgi:hypothetical protein
MSAPIASSTSALAATADGMRPQVQSRRVSVQLGPLGIRYSTDEVLWSAASTTAADISSDILSDVSGSVSAEGAASSASDAQAQASQTAAAASPQAQAQAAQTQEQAEGAGRTFNRELLDARQREARLARLAWTNGAGGVGTATYGADGSLNGVSDAEALAEGAEQEAAKDSTDEGASQKAADGFSAPGHLMRRAINAYLACAQDFRAAGPMLSATA